MHIIPFLVLGLIITDAYVTVIGRRGLSPVKFTTTIVTGLTTSRSTPTTTSLCLPFCLVQRKPSFIINTRQYGSIKDNNDITSSVISSSPKGFGVPPPPPPTEELDAKGKRAAQKQKYREQIKMAKTLPTLKKIVKSGVDDKVTTNSKVKGCGGAA